MSGFWRGFRRGLLGQIATDGFPWMLFAAGCALLWAIGYALMGAGR